MGRSLPGPYRLAFAVRGADRQIFAGPWSPVTACRHPEVSHPVGSGPGPSPQTSAAAVL